MRVCATWTAACCSSALTASLADSESMSTVEPSARVDAGRLAPSPGLNESRSSAWRRLVAAGHRRGEGAVEVDLEALVARGVRVCDVRRQRLMALAGALDGALEGKLCDIEQHWDGSPWEEGGGPSVDLMSPLLGAASRIDRPSRIELETCAQALVVDPAAGRRRLRGGGVAGDGSAAGAEAGELVRGAGRAPARAERSAPAARRRALRAPTARCAGPGRARRRAERARRWTQRAPPSGLRRRAGPRPARARGGRPRDPSGGGDLRPRRRAARRAARRPCSIISGSREHGPRAAGGCRRRRCPGAGWR